MKIPKVAGCVAAAASTAETAILVEVEGHTGTRHTASESVRAKEGGGGLRQATPMVANRQDQGTHELQVSVRNLSSC